ncbi:MAG TPA: cysteine synthase A [Woeseiaceae bacterium]|nr:cysteine synthase A [Woeseiaceae bacterium]
MPRYQNILQTIGRTPLVKLNKLAPPDVNVYVKVESFNPLGSVKDRIALAIIEDAEQRGTLRPGQTVIEATSGNTGIGLAMVCAQKGYPLVVTMAENFSIERRKMLRFLGARIVLTPAAAKGTGMLEKAVELAAAHGWFLCRQFENEANAAAHTRTTAAEILDDFRDVPLYAFVSGFGTGGTLLGVARGLKAVSPATQIVAAEPDNAQVLGSGIRQPRDGRGAPLASHPQFRPHLMQGWSPDFVSRLTERAVDEGLVDRIVPVSGSDAMRLAHDLARREGIFAGTSSGATLAAALDVARHAPPGSNIVCMLPDTAERYLSTPLFEQIGVDMDADELALSHSTPGYRFDDVQPVAVQPAVNAPAAAAATADADAGAYVDEVIGTNAIVLFALEWCEFCWSVRKLFTALGVQYKSVDLDSLAFQENGLGGRIRAVLKQRTGTPTIPQIYVGGTHVGGCTELFDALVDGSLERQFDACGIACDSPASIDPYKLLPQWMHPRRSA